MKKYIIAHVLSTFFVLHGMDGPPIIKQKPHKSSAKESAKSHAPHIVFFSSMLEKYAITIHQKKIVCVGCGPGEIAAMLAEDAHLVHGIDTSKNMIKYATQVHKNTTNLSFHHCFLEDFVPKIKYHLAIAPNCFHLFPDKLLALMRINSTLEPQGLFFANIETTQNPAHLATTVFEEIREEYPTLKKLLSIVSNPTGHPRPSNEELESMLTKTNFEIIKNQEESFEWKMTMDEWKQAQLSIFASTPGAQKLANLNRTEKWMLKKYTSHAAAHVPISPEEQKQLDEPFFPESTEKLVTVIQKNHFLKLLFYKFFNRCLQKSQHNDDGTYTYQYVVNVILAQKNKS